MKVERMAGAAAVAASRSQMLRRFPSGIRAYEGVRPLWPSQCAVSSAHSPASTSFSFSFSSSASESDQPSEPLSWFQKLKGFWGGSKAQTPAAGSPAVSVPPPASFNLESFADELKKARAFGKMTQFGRGLPRGGEAVAARSLEKQEEILRKLSTYSPDGQRLEARHKQDTAKSCGCTVNDVDNVLSKFEWAREANSRMMQLKVEGKPLPRTFDEVERMMGRSWNAAASRSLAKDGQPSRNSLCPCGSGKKFKRCCGRLEQVGV